VKFLYLPIETWSREYHAKVLLALHAVKNGWQVIIGPKSQMHRRLSRLPEGAVLQFGFHKNYASEMKRLRSYGHKIVTADEEGLVTLSPEHYKRYRISAETLKQCDRCFCWGEVHSQMILEVDDSVKNKLHITSNPRMDLLRPELCDLIEREAVELRKEYGRFLLLNGNFGSFNHAMGIDYTWKSIESKGWASTPKDKEFHHKRVELQGRFFKSFYSILPKITTEERKVIVRPHPSESLIPWEELSKAHPGKIIVVRKGNIIPWLKAAEAILHNGCTTAVEAFLLGRPVVSYRPEIVPELESELPNLISMQARNEAELLSLLENILDQDSKTRQQRTDYAQKFVDMNDTTYSCDKIVNALPKVTEHTEDKFKSLSCWKDKVVIDLKDLIGNFVYRQSSAYLGLKCGKLDLKKTNHLINEYTPRIKFKKDAKAVSIGNGLLLMR
jgi:surface carbohydrate biosynthesis protein